MRSLSDSDTLCSKFEYACTTYQRSATVLAPLPRQRARHAAQNHVEYPEEDAHHEHRDEHHQRGLQRLLARRPDDLAQLDARPLHELPEIAALDRLQRDKRSDAERGEHDQ